MNKSSAIIVAVIALVALALTAGYHWGQQQPHTPDVAATTKARDSERRVLYYRNPMGQPDTSPVPKKDSMGMDYIPVYADDADDAGVVRVTPGRMQTLGVRTETIQRERLDVRVQAAGRIEADERRNHVVNAKFDGWIERLRVDTTGQSVQRGQVLFEVYSPDLLAAQREYAIAARALAKLRQADEATRNGMQAVADASLARLRNWDVSAEQVRALVASGEPRRTLALRAPASGVVTRKTAVEGMRITAGEALYTITDLIQVWMIAQVYERDLAQLEIGSEANVSLDAFGAERFKGRVDYIYPTMDTTTRSVPVRVVLDNPDGRLKPGMFARADLATTERAPSLVAPFSAVIDNGEQVIVLVDQGEGRFAPRPVRTGLRQGDRIQILDGLSEGDSVVVAANFLIDADSRMMAAVSGFTAPTEATHDDHDGHAVDPSLPRHKAEATVESIDVAKGSIVLHHGPVPSLHWPPMTMPFTLSDPALAKDLSAGQAIDFEFVEPGPGQWIVTAIQVQDAARPEHAADGHSGKNDAGMEAGDGGGDGHHH
ncbi:MAG: efflux RND transporter periplasmic adaptor subunit [Xanthomonadales bacterium]|nr:efflux RND transporter periplasmic adaptor subunit [Xanthomonadales bacterium]